MLVNVVVVVKYADNVDIVVVVNHLGMFTVDDVINHDSKIRCYGLLMTMKLYIVPTYCVYQ